MNIIYGKPGAGKSHLLTPLRESINYLSVGDITRHEMALGTPIGREMLEIAEIGGHYPHYIGKWLCETLIDKASLSNKPSMIDGYPKYVDEGHYFKSVITNEIAKSSNIFELNTPEDICLERVKSRVLCNDCGSQHNRSIKGGCTCPDCGGVLAPRHDDSLELITKRIEVYNNQTLEVIEGLEVFGFKRHTLQWDSPTTDLMERILEQING